MFWRKHRFKIVTREQHLFTHSLSEFAYTNPATPGATNVESALNYILAVLYPNTQPNVANVAALPSTGNTINDYRVVDDDGDGKSAGYRWEQREGEGAASWHKIFDVDWSTDAILAALQDVTDVKYVFKNGKSDLDGAGAPITGLYAGQIVYGGNLANQNLTLNANSGDGVGPQTGFVQTDSNFRPTLDDTYGMGTLTERFTDAFLSNSIVVDTITITSGNYVDTSGAIAFGSSNLSTTGNFDGATITGTSLVADDTVNSMTLVPGSITDDTGAISFGAANLSTTGTLGAGVATLTDNAQTIILDPDNGASRAQITSTLGAIDFVDENLFTSGTLNAGDITGTRLDADNLRLDGNTLSLTDTNGNILVSANGTGIVDVQSPLQTLGITATGTVGVTGQLNADNLRLDGNTLSSTDTNGNIVISPDGTGFISITKDVVPLGDNTLDFGGISNALKDVYFKGVLSDGTNSITSGTVLALRHTLYRDVAETAPAQSGDALFFNGTVWLANPPDAEIDHGGLSGIGDDDHTQYALLAGRSGGQVLNGSTLASQDLILDSTSNATKGSILLRSDLKPETNASFSAGWSGTDLGDGTHYLRDIYSKGEFRGLRIENFTTAGLPAASAQNVGRLVFDTDKDNILIDVGTSLKTLNISKFNGDQTFNGVDLTKTVDVSASITDARNAIWQLMDNANNFEILFVKLEVLSATQVRITTTVPLPAGSYRLIGLE